MARRLDEFPPTRRGRPAKYPWDEWLNGSIWELTPGEDFEGTKRGLKSSAYQRARFRGLRIRARALEGDGPMYLQAVSKDEAVA